MLLPAAIEVLGLWSIGVIDGDSTIGLGESRRVHKSRCWGILLGGWGSITNIYRIPSLAASPVKYVTNTRREQHDVYVIFTNTKAVRLPRYVYVPVNSYTQALIVIASPMVLNHFKPPLLLSLATNKSG
ncbi:MAG: hypothetical protein DRO09_03420 [Thermoprotei archaeon]|nr:MAG: hypothetical protein DRO09_03420 [Thermoprotei archaeon]